MTTLFIPFQIKKLREFKMEAFCNDFQISNQMISCSILDYLIPSKKNAKQKLINFVFWRIEFTDEYLNVKNVNIQPKEKGSAIIQMKLSSEDGSFIIKAWYNLLLQDFLIFRDKKFVFSKTIFKEAGPGKKAHDNTEHFSKFIIEFSKIVSNKDSKYIYYEKFDYFLKIKLALFFYRERNWDVLFLFYEMNGFFLGNTEFNLSNKKRFYYFDFFLLNMIFCEEHYLNKIAIIFKFFILGCLESLIPKTNEYLGLGNLTNQLKSFLQDLETFFPLIKYIETVLNFQKEKAAKIELLFFRGFKFFSCITDHKSIQNHNISLENNCESKSYFYQMFRIISVWLLEGINYSLDSIFCLIESYNELLTFDDVYLILLLFKNNSKNCNENQRNILIEYFKILFIRNLKFECLTYMINQIIITLKEMPDKDLQNQLINEVKKFIFNFILKNIDNNQIKINEYFLLFFKILGTEKEVGDFILFEIEKFQNNKNENSGKTKEENFKDISPNFKDEKFLLFHFFDKLFFIWSSYISIETILSIFDILIKNSSISYEEYNKLIKEAIRNKLIKG